MRITLDTKVLAYAEGVNGAPRRTTALALIERLAPESTLVPVQVLGELFQVLVRKAQWEPRVALKSILDWRDTFALIETTPSVLFTAAELSTRHKIGIWDAVVLFAAAGCRLLLSEDLEAGFTWNGVTVANPFAEPKHELLAGCSASEQNGQALPRPCQAEVYGPKPRVENRTARAEKRKTRAKVESESREARAQTKPAKLFSSFS